MTRRGSAQELRHATAPEPDNVTLLHDDELNRLTQGVFLGDVLVLSILLVL